VLGVWSEDRVEEAVAATSQIRDAVVRAEVGLSADPGRQVSPGRRDAVLLAVGRAGEALKADRPDQGEPERVGALAQRRREDLGVVLGRAIDRLGKFRAETGDEAGAQVTYEFIVRARQRSRQRVSPRTPV
jgi:hypothetical protein